MSEPLSQAINAEQWAEVLSDVGHHLERLGVSARLCVIGSVACMFDGADTRTSIDCDVWVPGSQFHRKVLREAAEAAGLMFDPKQEVVESPYLQLVSPGIVEVGDYDKDVLISNSGKLSLSRPPVENLIASKLLRGSEKDIADIAGLLTRHPTVTPDAVEKVLETFPSASRNKAAENLVFLHVLQKAESIPDRPSHKESTRNRQNEQSRQY
jgi:hypothetical protein